LRPEDKLTRQRFLIGRGLILKVCLSLTYLSGKCYTKKIAQS